MDTHPPQLDEKVSLSGLEAPGRILLAVLIVAVILQPVSTWLQGFVNWDIVNPATNHAAWYWASLQHWLFSWVWPAAFLTILLLKKDYLRAWLLMVVLCVLVRGGPEPFFQGSLTIEEQWQIALVAWYEALLLDAITAAMAVAVVRRRYLMIFVVHITALRIFI